MTFPKTTLLIAALATLMGLPHTASAEEPIVIRMATLAPLKSPWGQVFLRAKREVEEKSNGMVKIRLFAGGSRGDEKVMVRKMRSGQLEGAAITSIGLSEIAKEVLVLQAPGLIRSNRTLDFVRGRLSGRFEELFKEKGYILLGWGDVGMTYLMGGTEVKNPADLANAKPWVWETDPIFRSLYGFAGASPTPLTVPDVLMGLTNSVIDTIYASPVAAVSLQWHSNIRFINSKLINIGIGATVVTEAVWNRATPEQQTLIREITGKWHRVLLGKVRSMNTNALNTLRQRGAQVVAGDSAKWEALFKQVQNGLVPSI